MNRIANNNSVNRRCTACPSKSRIEKENTFSGNANIFSSMMIQSSNTSWNKSINSSNIIKQQNENTNPNYTVLSLVSESLHKKISGRARSKIETAYLR